jgi:hypothetical protein
MDVRYAKTVLAILKDLSHTLVQYMVGGQNTHPESASLDTLHNINKMCKDIYEVSIVVNTIWKR